MGTEYIAVGFTILFTIATSTLLGRYMFKVFTGNRTLLDPIFVPIERLVLQVVGVGANEQQDWKQYSSSLLISNVVMWLATWTIVTLQNLLPLSAPYGTIMFMEIKRGILFTVVTMVLLGGGYNVLVWGIGRTVFAAQAEGSLIRRANGTVIGSRLIAQRFMRSEYFHPRPSGVDYNAASTGGTNYGPSNPDHLKAVKERLDAVMKQEGVTANQVPSEMVTASGGGMDPHIPPAAADLQAERVATARGVPVDRVRELIRAHTEPPTWGFLGRARINVLELNLALDEALGAPKLAPVSSA